MCAPQVTRYTYSSCSHTRQHVDACVART